MERELDQPKRWGLGKQSLESFSLATPMWHQLPTWTFDLQTTGPVWSTLSCMAYTINQRKSSADHRLQISENSSQCPVFFQRHIKIMPFQTVEWRNFPILYQDSSQFRASLPRTTWVTGERNLVGIAENIRASCSKLDTVKTKTKTPFAWPCALSHPRPFGVCLKN